jgi:Protein of unknown function (DUF3160)
MANPKRSGPMYLAMTLTVVLTIASAAQDGNDSDWQALALQRGLSDADVQQLEANRILTTDESYKQVFRPYLGSPLPVFVTSDSLLNAYHVLYEESVLRLEQAGTRQLPDILRFILTNLDAVDAGVEGQAELVAAARQRATIIVGTALKVLDDEFAIADDALMAIIDDEVSKIVAAEVKMKPGWLGPPEPDFLSLDYTCYKARGFYTRNDTLTRYFRAVAWLQSIPFRLSHDDELLSILLLGQCLAPERFADETETYEAYRKFFRTYTEFLGVGDDWDLITAADSVAGGGDLEAKRAELLAQAQQEGGPQINDQLRFAPDDPNAVAEPNFRIISAYRLPDAVLFQRTTDIRTFLDRPFPNGLEVCIALGSAFARERIEDVEKAKLLATIEENLGLFAGTSLYFDYLNTIAALLDAPEPNAPAFMAGEPWQAKSCGTALAGWAQLRHTWVLQAKLNAAYACITIPPPGFVEPEPEFFRRLADLAARTNDLLASAGAFGSNYLDLIEALAEITDLLEQSEDLENFGSAFWALPEDNRDRLWAVEIFVRDLEGEKEARVEQLRRMIEDLNEGIVDPSLEWLVGRYGVDLEPLWPLLEETSRYLESIARKQLDGVALSGDDTDFLNGYGATIACIMLYGGNSYHTPQDDAPRIVDVYSNPWVGGNLHVGISRARALYVLYPWEGQAVLCRGAVMPYYEFVDSGRLTDIEWKERLDSDSRPDVPSWLRPIIGEEGFSAPFATPASGRGR